MCVLSVITTKKRYGRPVDTTAKEGVVLVWGDLWVLRKRRGMVLVGETCEYHSRGEEYKKRSSVECCSVSSCE